jgi:hypothetical protein
MRVIPAGMRRRLGRETGRGRELVAATTAVAAGLVAVGQAGPAAAAEFTIQSCLADSTGYSTQAFEDFATRGMMWKRACNPEGRGLRGLITSNVVRKGRVRRGARAYFVLRAPTGTRFSRFRWSGQARREDCRYALQIWASRPSASSIPIKNVRANRKCPRGPRAQAAGWPRPRTYEVPGATSIVQRVVCVGAKGTPFCSSRGRNYIRTFKASATVVDISRPLVRIRQDNPFTLGRWVGGAQVVTYDAADNVGVRSARALISGISQGEHLRACNYAQRVPCLNGRGRIDIDTRTQLGEGSQTMVVEAQDAAQNTGSSNAVFVRIDNTAPGAVPVSLAGGDNWRNANGFDLSWSNPSEGDRAPIVASHYRLCSVDGGACANNTRIGPSIARLDDISVPAAGQWRLSMWRQDAAGNHEPANASVPVVLRFDPEPPRLGFEQSSTADPTLVAVQVTDEYSGLASGQIELSGEGSGTWQVLPTQQHGNRLLARIDDARLPAGTYVLRATARDQATNLSSTDSRLDGRPMVVTLPLRTPTVTRAGVITRRRVRRTVRRNGKRITQYRRVAEVRPAARFRFGEGARIVGRLESRDGRPVPNAELHIFAASSTVAEHEVSVLRTDGAGRYTYDVPPGSTRAFRVVYLGTPVTLPSQGGVGIQVRSASTIRSRPRRLRNGQSVRFNGRVQSLPTPPAGKLVELQVTLSGRWQTFRTTRTDLNGAWHVRYRFRRSCGLTRYRFRARLPRETSYPFETGFSRATKVRVRGAPCR